jgi:DNA-directed RNA polymerase
MEFFQRLAQIMARRNMHLTYRTPHLNFPVHQYYRKEDKKGSAGRQKVYMYDHELKRTERNKKMTFIQYTDTVDEDKSVSAIAPNVIHSMDSTMLMLAVLECERLGFTDLMVVHDSFATTAGNAARMAAAVKTAFVKLYDGYCLYTDLLEQTKARHPDPDNIEINCEIDELHDKIAAATGEERKRLQKDLQAKERLVADWPTIPEKGDLDIKDVMDSDYFVT